MKGILLASVTAVLWAVLAIALKVAVKYFDSYSGLSAALEHKPFGIESLDLTAFIYLTFLQRSWAVLHRSNPIQPSRPESPSPKPADRVGVPPARPKPCPQDLRGL